MSDALARPLAVALLVLALWALFAARPESPGDAPTAEPASDHVDRARSPALLVPGPLVPQPTPDSAQARLLRGRVLSARHDEPIVDALVLPAAAGHRDVSMRAGVRTGLDGSFVVPAPAGEDVTLVVVANGYLPWEGADPSFDTAVGGTVHLDRGGTVSGAVVDLAGAGVPGVRVWCALEGNASWPNPGEHVSRCGGSGGLDHTDGEGGFTIRGLEPGRSYVLRTHKTGWGAGDHVRAAVTPGDRDLTLRLFRETTFEVTPIDAQTGLPVCGAVRTCRCDGCAPSMGSAWGADGLAARRSSSILLRFVESGAATPKVTLTLRAAGYETTAAHFSPQESETFNVAMKRVDPRPDCTLGFSARFTDGRPYSGRLLLVMAGEGGRSELDLLFEDGEAVEQTRVPPGRYRVVPHGIGGGATWGRAGPEVVVDAEPGGNQAPVLELRGAQFDLTVKDEGGRVVRGFAVFASRDGRQWSGSASWDLLRRVEPGEDKEAPLRLLLPEGRSRVTVFLEGLLRSDFEVAGQVSGVVEALEVTLDEPWR